ncbi:MAG: carbohydrate binding family 9 domain-containing protein [Acidobacteria bacterium]|nr:carbohydrate binding family 9 domain-containing protein [Acidobacteriota bacterium]
MFPLTALPAAAQQAPASEPRIVTAVRLAPEETIRLDGVPNEAVWERAAPATDFRQRDPDNGAPATEQTEVRLLYDADRLILGVVLHDSEPDRLLGNQMQRDQAFSADDRFMWAIDTFRDGRSGYFFEINPSGAMGDGLIDPSSDGGGLGAGANKSWDGIWTARVRRGPGGWTAEIEIPFKTLNFDPAADAWGINFQRTVRRKNEESLWTGYARNQGLRRMSNAGVARGFDGLSQGVGLDLKPYVVGSVAAAPGRGAPSAVSSGDVGLDAFYNVTPALRANVSLNTDFAETEVDQRQVNLTRFPLFFEEKRDFFLEGSSYFDFARELGNQVTPFFSRRIGLDARGTPQRIDVGAKLTGQAGAFDLGLLQVRTADSPAEAGADFSVARVRRRLLAQSYVGGVYTRRSNRVPGARDLHTAGVDFSLRTATFRGDKTVDLSGWYLSTSNPLETGDSAGFGSRLQFPNDPFYFDFSYRELQPNYNPAVGFLQRTGFRRFNPEIGYTWRFSRHPWARYLQSEIDWEFYNNQGNRALSREYAIRPVTLSFNDGSEVAFEVAPNYERLLRDFEISDGVVLPAGGVHEFTRYALSGEMADRYPVALGGEMTLGDFFSGARREYSLNVALRPRPGVAVTLEAEHNVLNLAEGSFETDVFRARANTQVSPWISLVNNVQYDTVSRLIGWQLRFRWIRVPGNDLYFVYTHNWREELEGGVRRFATLDRRASSKLVYTLRF